MTAQRAPRPNNDAVSDRLCQTLVGWTLMAAQHEHQAFQSRYTLVFAIIGFGAGICTVLAQQDHLILGFLFLLCMVGFSLRLNHHYDRKARAWLRTRKELEKVNHIVSYYGISAGRDRPINIKKPHQIWNDFHEEYFVRPLDLLSRLIYLIAMLIFVGSACCILGEYEFYFVIEERQ